MTRLTRKPCRAYPALASAKSGAGIGIPQNRASQGAPTKRLFCARSSMAGVMGALRGAAPRCGNANPVASATPVIGITRGGSATNRGHTMSIPAVLAAVQQTTLSATSKLVLIHLANRLNDQTGQCNPSVPTLAADAGLSRKTVSKALWNLRERGFIHFEKQHRQTPNYRLVFLESYGSSVPDLGVNEGALRGNSGHVYGHSGANLGERLTPQPVKKQERNSIDGSFVPLRISTRHRSLADDINDTEWAL